MSDDEDLIEKIKIYRNHGQTDKNVHSHIGFNCRLEEVQAAVLRVKLKHLEKWNFMRRKNASVYNEMLKDCKVIVPTEKEYNKHVYHLYVVRVKERQKVMEHLNSKGIQTGIHYPTPIHLQEAYSFLGHKKGSFPVSEGYADEILSLPMFAELNQDQISAVADCIKSALK